MTSSPQPQSVRFSDVHQEIEPEQAVQDVAELTGTTSVPHDGPLSPQAEEDLRNLSSTLQKSRMQAKRMENFSYEPVSLPPSRAPSPNPASRTTSVHSGHRSSIASSPASAMHSPPLTPAGTSSRDEKTGAEGHRKHSSDPAMITPQVSPPHEPPPPSMNASVQGPNESQLSLPVPASPRIVAHSPRPSSDLSGAVQSAPKRGSAMAMGHASDSNPASRDASPARSGGERTSGTSTPAPGSRPYTPQGEREDTYTRSKRAAQARNLDSLEARFVYGGRDGRNSAASSTYQLPRSRGTESDTETNKRSSIFGKMSIKGHSDAEDSKSQNSKHGSMSELKRFFKIGHKNKDKDKDKEKRKESPAPSIKNQKIKSNKSGTMTPPMTNGSISVPFADDHGLQSKYGKFGKVLGSGAGGSVRLMKRSSDGTTFAVKQFRNRHSYESEKDYNKKVTAEFCIGSTLHHGNIIETMDLVNEKGNYYVVMEYAPYDLFAIVMTGKMSREEVTCCTLQILNGVTYLHSMGLAHRDLKLDNVVVNEHGIMKIIDFGSAAVFKYPFEDEIVLASGIVGSDPYLAPEVYDLAKYDPQPTDIWSLAIMFCCMTLRRFPWKAPRISDNSYKLFVSPPNDGPRSITGPARSATDVPSTASDDRRQSGITSEPASRHPSEHAVDHRASTSSTTSQQPPQVIKGPWRLLRLLPRESRHIIGRMLEVDPKKRATLDEILEDKWVTNSAVCTQEEGGRVVRCDNHEHTLEPGAGVSSAANTQQKK
ncbi:Nitrogen permease reactivator protein [Pyrenophora tritici-repentis]|uniref:non-specific serine/threonine protein kinase n=1 Tax=Pyrenophora tritici-repentis TaxID=45151 RepID=A0A922NC32_9PLEO|nr:Nitrogen permease reactivator protein [Pyrenophora tritici-repentis]KAI1664958.1 Nitrogen permease reactivator protein [Pyrenophora tritici-repentis]KAI1690067.1 Nitrogen permease reactivator protein [Pyrenophora tritici-repentis]